MPYINVKITNEGVTTEQKEAIIAGMTQVLVDVLNKNPATTPKTITTIKTVTSVKLVAILPRILRKKGTRIFLSGSKTSPFYSPTPG